MVKYKGKACKKVKNFYHCKIAPKTKFDKRSFRTKKLTKGRRLVIGCPKGKWSPKKSRCKVGTRAQKLLIPVK